MSGAGNKKTRVNMRISTDLLKWAKSYSKKHGSCVTKMVVGILTTIRQMELDQKREHRG